MRILRSNKCFDIVNILAVSVILLLILYPLYFVIIASLSDPYEVVKGNVIFGIRGFSIDSYIQVFKNKDIWIGYRNSVVYTILGTGLSLLTTIPAAYALSRKYLWGRNILTSFFVITMFISGGVLPTYLTVRDIGLMNKPFTLVVLGSFSVFNLLVAKAYFQSEMPESVLEAAEIDGCSEFKKFFYIVLPLSRPIVAVIALYYAVERWNDFYNALIYISDADYYPLQLVLRNILMENQINFTSIGALNIPAEEMAFMVRRAYMAEAMKYAVIFIASLPMWLIFPFVQKYFVKGVMAGSIKE